MFKLTTITFTLIAALSFGATTANAGAFSNDRAPQPGTASSQHCQDGVILHGKCHIPNGPQFGGMCSGPHFTNCPPDGSTIPDCKGGSQTIYGTTHECL